MASKLVASCVLLLLCFQVALAKGEADKDGGKEGGKSDDKSGGKSDSKNDGSTGVYIQNEAAIVSLGSKGDVSIQRTGASEGTVTGNLKTEGIDSSKEVAAMGFMLKKRKVDPDECKPAKAGLFARNLDGEVRLQVIIFCCKYDLLCM